MGPMAQGASRRTCSLLMASFEHFIICLGIYIGVGSQSWRSGNGRWELITILVMLVNLIMDPTLIGVKYEKSYARCLFILSPTVEFQCSTFKLRNSLTERIQTPPGEA